ncbi:hypothetical protein PG984_010197 [Apiospora sp. TS-2023a]
MAFHRFPNLPPEIRAQILEDALHQEVKGRLLLLHRCTGRIVPTKNNISALLSVSVEVRQAAKSFYSVRLPVFRMPPRRPGVLMTFEEWAVDTADWRWGRGIGPHGQSWTNRERYWYHYALPHLGEAADDFITIGSFKKSARQGCIFLNPTTDRFMLSHKAHHRDKSEYVEIEGSQNWPGYRPYAQDTNLDICAYLMTLKDKADILGPDPRQEFWPLKQYEIPRYHLTENLPTEVTRTVRNIVFCDVKDDPMPGPETPAEVFGELLGDVWFPDGTTRSGTSPTHLGELVDIDGETLGDKDVEEWWLSYSYTALLEPPRKLLYLEIPASKSCTLTGEVEAHTAEGLDIREIMIDGPSVDEPEEAHDSGGD